MPAIVLPFEKCAVGEVHAVGQREHHAARKDLALIIELRALRRVGRELQADKRFQRALVIAILTLRAPAAPGPLRAPQLLGVDPAAQIEARVGPPGEIVAVAIEALVP